MQKPIKKLGALLAAGGLLAYILVPSFVFAETTFQNGNEVVLENVAKYENNKFMYDGGYATLTVNGSVKSAPMASLGAGDTVVISLYPDEGYIAHLYDIADYDVDLTDNTYSFTIDVAESETLRFTPFFRKLEITYDFTLNGVSFTDVKDGDVLTVPDNFAIGEVKNDSEEPDEDPFYFTRINIKDERTYEYITGDYGYHREDSEGRKILETNFTKISDNAGILRVIAHGDDIDPDSRFPDTDYYNFYITGIYFVKSAFRGVEVSTNVMPDNYDFTSWNGVDLSTTSAENPGEVTVYYGEDTIKLEAPLSGNIAEINVLGDIPVEISDLNHTVTVLSNFYNEIPLEVKLGDGTVGYLNVKRIGLFISRLNKGADTLYHGAFALVGQNLNKYTDKNRIAATFYHKDTETYEDYDLIATLTYADGTTEIVTAEGVGDVHNTDGDITGSDYIIWKGENNIPIKVSVTAVKKGALNNENTFGGAAFGSGAGVTEEFDN